jgi:hypothetical protein
MTFTLPEGLESEVQAKRIVDEMTAASARHFEGLSSVKCTYDSEPTAEERDARDVIDRVRALDNVRPWPAGALSSALSSWLYALEAPKQPESERRPVPSRDDQMTLLKQAIDFLRSREEDG